MGIQLVLLIKMFEIPGHTDVQILDAKLYYNTHQLITREIPGHTAGNHATITCHHIRGVLCTHMIPGYSLTFVHMLTYLPNPHALCKKKMVENA